MSYPATAAHGKCDMRTQPTKLKGVPGVADQRFVRRLDVILLCVFIVGMAAMIPLAVLTVGSTHEWIYWTDGGIVLSSMIIHWFLPPNDKVSYGA